MNALTSATTRTLIPEPAETINLADYYFDGTDFNWKNIALTQFEWPMRGYGDGEHTVNLTSDTHDLFWIRYKDVELTFNLDTPDTVNWADAVGIAFNVTTSPIVPTNPVEFLYFLNLDSHPEADNMVEFWTNLLKLLGFIRAFQEN